MTKTGEKILRKVVEFAVVFFVNMVLFSVSMILSDIAFRNCLLYSFINALWMSLLLMPLLERLWNKRGGK